MSYFKDGPTTYTKQCTTCTGCNFLDNKLIRSGLNPERAYYCTHKTVQGDDASFAIGIFYDQAGYIGKDPNTPKWCPVLKKK